MTTTHSGSAQLGTDAVSSTRFVAPGIDSLNVRMGPSSAYPAVGLLMPGARVTGMSYAGWLQITEGPLVGGCVSTDYLTGDRPTATPSTPCPRIVGRVTTDNQFANIRSGPGFGHRIVGRYACHEQVTGALVDDGPWVRTERGYVNAGTIAIYATNPAALNGCIPLRLLSPIPLCYNASAHFEPGYTPDTPRYLNGSALAALHRLQAAFKRRFGHYATIDLTYRSYDEQQYWHRKFGSPRAAHPGTSNHGYGLAIDFEERDEPWIYSWGAVANRWLLTHQSGFGFDNPYAATLQEGEDYHFNFVG
ncbi:MAG TPA: D-alanyl-D-alanine carboxypeptidase family protein [Flexivirga sp.]|uniref:D-alanyl-D-alanine carboxypeptidase family protein n=1 Tax=Flexivirga sp. TaxID=1962927 RepID=UPI002BB06548|nr:D-alanyl-D-alanine carboxypeptidase family protein [Flexivirga sp.]HWC24520.1 D-alanyl-D-alanine carboxypeptidase family protein [Flexivirga sp.]